MGLKTRTRAAMAIARRQHWQQAARRTAGPAAAWPRRRPATGLISRLGGQLVWLHRLQMRHELTLLDVDQLRDAGLNPHVVQREIEKWFWQA